MCLDRHELCSQPDIMIAIGIIEEHWHSCALKHTLMRLEMDCGTSMSFPPSITATNMSFVATTCACVIEGGRGGGRSCHLFARLFRDCFHWEWLAWA